MIQLPFTPPQDLSRPSLFVAYERATRRVGTDDGEAVDFRPSCYIRDYPSIRVKTITPKTVTVNGEPFDLVSIEFEAASVPVKPPLTNDFGASFKADPELLRMLEQARATGQPVWVTLETVRRPKTKSGEPVPVMAPIHELRGAQPNGKGGNANITGDNCKNLLVAAGLAGRPETVRFTDELRSDPGEWGQMRRNHDGTLPPDGWRVYAGGLVPAASAPGVAGTVEAIAAAVAARLTVVKTSDAYSAAPASRPAQRAGFAAESRPWEPWNTDGRVNAGSYLVGKWRAMAAEALAVLADDRALAPGERLTKMRVVADHLMAMADEVQSRARGGARPDRSARSHAEASHWITFVYTDLAMTPGMEQVAVSSETFADPARLAQWTLLVTQTAAYLMTDALSSIEEHMNGAVPAPFITPEAAPPPALDQAPTSSAASAGLAPETPGVVERFWQLVNACTAFQGAPNRLHPLLTELFGVTDVTQAPADILRQHLVVWERDPGAFVEAAHQAWLRAAAVVPS